MTGDRTALARPVPLGARSTAMLLLVTAIGVVGFGWPLLAAPGSGLAHSGDAPWLFAALLPLLLAVVVAQIAEGRVSTGGQAGLEAKSIALLGVLAAAGAAIRPLGAGTAGLEPTFFLMVLSGRVLGPGFGFVLGNVSLFASALLTGGVGPWLPFQMLAMGWVCLGAGLLPGPSTLRGRRERWMLAGYGAIAAELYGLVMDLQGWPYIAGLGTHLSYVAGDPLGPNLARFLAYHFTTALGWDIPRSVLTAVLCLSLGHPVLAALRRASRRAAFDAPVGFAPPRSGDKARTGRPMEGGPKLITMPTAPVNGVTLAYDDHRPADGSRPVVLLIHGHPFDRSMWSPQVAALTAAGYRVITSDLRGYGASEVVPGVTTLEQFARDQAALLDALGVDKAVVGGLSMGGQIVMEFCRLFPERVSAVLLADTFPRAETEQGKVFRNQVADRLLKEGMAGYADEVIDKMVAPAPTAFRAEVAAHVLGMMRATPPEGAAAALRGRALRPDYCELLTELRVPAWVVVGADDEYTPVGDAEFMHESLPDSTLTVVPAAGHMPNLEYPEVFNPALLAFLETLPDARA